MRYDFIFREQESGGIVCRCKLLGTCRDRYIDLVDRRGNIVLGFWMFRILSDCEFWEWLIGEWVIVFKIFQKVWNNIFYMWV